MSETCTAHNEIEKKTAADSFVAQLQTLHEGKSISVIANGTSMRPRIESGQTISISPVDLSMIEVNDIVLVRWKKGSFLTHQVKKIEDGRFLIGNTWRKTNDWVNASDVLGIVTEIN